VKRSLGTTKSRNVRVDGRRTGVRLERAEWDALREVMAFERVDLKQICSLVDQQRSESAFTSGLRVFLLKYFRRRAHIGGGNAPLGLDSVLSD
jgi:predicted DNA-binding ribbon-helix-helix protein